MAITIIPRKLFHHFSLSHLFNVDENVHFEWWYSFVSLRIWKGNEPSKEKKTKSFSVFIMIRLRTESFRVHRTMFRYILFFFFLVFWLIRTQSKNRNEKNQERKKCVCVLNVFQVLFLRSHNDFELRDKVSHGVY